MSKPPAAAVTSVLVAILLCIASNARAQCLDDWKPGDGIPGVESYDPNNPDGQVLAMTIWDPDGPGPQPQVLIVAGVFTMAGNVMANRIAAWDGTSWHPLGSGVDGEYADVVALAVYEGNLIAAGYFTSAGGTATTNIAQWDGTKWEPVGGAGTWSPNDSYVDSLTVHNGKLIAGGAFSTIGDVVANNIAEWDGVEWQPLGAGVGDLNTIVGMMASYNGNLIVSFYDDSTYTTFSLIQWNGTCWQAFAQQPNRQVYAMTVWNGSLIVGGEFTAIGSVAAKGIAQWDGTNWQAISPGVIFWL